MLVIPSPGAAVSVGTVNSTSSWQKDTLTTRSRASLGTFCPLTVEDGVLYSFCGASWLTHAPRSVLGCRTDGPLLQGSASVQPPPTVSAVLGVPWASVSLSFSGQCLPPGPSSPTCESQPEGLQWPETPPAHALSSGHPGDLLLAKDPILRGHFLGQ